MKKNILEQFIDFDYYLLDKQYQFEVESKGCLLNVKILFPNDNIYNLSFYEIERFKSEVEEELFNKNFFYEENIIFIKKVTLENLIDLIDEFNIKKYYLRLIV